MLSSIYIKFGILTCALQFVCDAVPLRIGPRVPDAFAFGASPEQEIYMERDDDLHGNDGASKYKNLGQGPKMVDIQGPPIRVQAELREAMEEAEAKLSGIGAAPLQPVVQGALININDGDKSRKAERENDDSEDDDIIPDSEKTRLRTLGRMLSSTDYDSSISDYDLNAEANEIWEQIGRISRKFQEKSMKMKESLSVKDRKAAAGELRKEVVGQLGELSVSLAEIYPFGNKDGLLERLGAAKNTIQQNIDSILLGYNLHYDKDNL